MTIWRQFWRFCADCVRADQGVSIARKACYPNDAMLTNRDDFERYLESSGRPFSKLDDATLLVTLARGQPPAVLRVHAPLAVIQVEICNVEFQKPTDDSAFYRKLLELNATDLLHASYGLAGNRVELSAALELEHLDENELEAALSDVALGLVNHVPQLRQMITEKA